MFADLMSLRVHVRLRVHSLSRCAQVNGYVLMRQAGVIAAAGIWALDHHIQRLAEDHENARIMEQRISAINGMKVDPSPQSNLVFFNVSGTGWDAREISKELRKQEIWIGVIDQYNMRAVTHLDVSQSQIHQAMDALNTLVN